LGGASSSTSKVAIISKSNRDDCDVDYEFGAVSVNSNLIDYSGNCGNLTAAVGLYAIHNHLLKS
jgi:2-methylaconitate cis-trans-isomerase PrpF